MEIDVTKRINPIARIVIIKDDYILLTSATKDNNRFSSDLHFLPGGHVEHTESARETILREMKEEFQDASKVKVVGFLGALECVWDNDGEPYHEIDIVFKGEADSIDISNPPKSKEGHIEYNWYKMSDLESLNLLPSSYIKLISKWLEDYNDNIDEHFKSEFYGKLL